MSFTALTFQLAIIVGTVCGSFAAWQQGAAWATPLFTILSFYMSLYTGLVFMWLADMAWFGSLGPDPRVTTKTADATKTTMCGWLHRLMPLPAMSAAAAACIFATRGILWLIA